MTISDTGVVSWPDTTDSSVGLVSHDAGRLTLTTRSVTRTPSAGSVSWQVPDEIVRTLIVQPFVRVGSDLLLAQRNADGTCIPVLLRISGGWGPEQDQRSQGRR
ncbi:MAG: hypothetical protein V8Q54_03755, partial [Alistipes senegalensis]